MEPVGKHYWLISAPKTREDTFNTLKKKTTDENDYSTNNYRFQVPELKVGTLDSLMSLSDELHKVDNQVENIVKKIANQLFDLLDTNKDANTNKYDSLTVNNSNIDTYLTFFLWDEAKYPQSQSLKTLTETIQTQVLKLDEELKGKSSEYNSLVHTLSAEERKAGGNLVIKDLSDIVQQKHIVESEFMDTLLVCVPKPVVKPFLATYETLAEFVVPRSAEQVAEDNEYALFRVVLFKKCVDDFKNTARDKKYLIREFKFDPNHSSKADKKKLEQEKDKSKKNLIRWCKTNFSEVFVAWIHLKAIRVFVESVLRYGLPTNFQAMLILPNKSKIKKLRQVLAELYGHLSSKSVFSGQKTEEEDPAEDKFFPYVFLEINLDFRRAQV